jgi:hypothetical protein
MLPAPEPALSLSEWIVLSVVGEEPSHGNALAILLGRDGELGQIWQVNRAGVYRSLDRRWSQRQSWQAVRGIPFRARVPRPADDRLGPCDR